MKLGDVVNAEAAQWGKPLDGVRVLALEQMQALPYATQLLGRLGADRVTFETDYPHTDSTWPDTRAVAEEMVQHLTDDDVYAIMRGNAIRMLALDRS